MYLVFHFGYSKTQDNSTKYKNQKLIKWDNKKFSLPLIVDVDRKHQSVEYTKNGE